MATKSQSAEVLLKQLKEPFEPKLVKFRVGGGSTQLAYIDARDVMKRLDDVMGVENWQDKYTAVEGGFICELSLRIGDEWITKSNGANNTKIEAVKGGISSALKRAAVEWGVGRYLYYLPKSAKPNNVAQWPAWAKPGSNVEKWEDVAEMEADQDTGMDEEEVFENALTITEKIRNADSTEALKKIKDELDPTAQRLLADLIANKADELTRNDTSS